MSRRLKIGGYKMIDVIDCQLFNTRTHVILFKAALSNSKSFPKPVRCRLLALSFLLLIGTLLVAEGFHQKIPKGYVYFAMAFCLGVEMLQMRTAKLITEDLRKSS